MPNQRRVTAKIIALLRLEVDAIDKELVELVRQRSLKIAQIQKLRASSHPVKFCLRLLDQLKDIANFFLLREKKPITFSEEISETEEGSNERY